MTEDEYIWVAEEPGSEVSSHSSQWLSSEAIAQVLLQCWVRDVISGDEKCIPASLRDA